MSLLASTLSVSDRKIPKHVQPPVMKKMKYSSLLDDWDYWINNSWIKPLSIVAVTKIKKRKN